MLNKKRTRLIETGARNWPNINRMSSCTPGVVTDLFRLVVQTGDEDTRFQSGRELGKDTYDRPHSSPHNSLIVLERAQEPDAISLPSQLLNPFESYLLKSV